MGTCVLPKDLELARSRFQAWRRRNGAIRVGRGQCGYGDLSQKCRRFWQSHSRPDIVSGLIDALRPCQR
jgi:hypothetical protein